jgi:hypothetical protein
MMGSPFTLGEKKFSPGANPTIMSYNATGSLACFENKNILYYFKKMQ